jgi:hypothetical protein
MDNLNTRDYLEKHTYGLAGDGGGAEGGRSSGDGRTGPRSLRRCARSSMRPTSASTVRPALGTRRGHTAAYPSRADVHTEVPPEFFHDSDDEEGNADERISGMASRPSPPPTLFTDRAMALAAPDKQRDRRIVPDEEFSDSDDEGTGGRRDVRVGHAPAPAPAATTAAGAPAAVSAAGQAMAVDAPAPAARTTVSTRRGKVTAAGSAALATDMSLGSGTPW